MSWDELSKSGRSIYIVVDEAQVIYGPSAPFFWGTLKEIRSTQCNPHLRLLLIAMHDMNMGMLTTPLDFANALGLDVLRIGYKDLQQVVSRFVAIRREKEGSPNFCVPEEVQQAIYNLSAGHVGMCRLALVLLRQCFKDCGRAQEMLRYLLSPEFRACLRNTRVLAWLEDWHPNNAESNLLRDLLYNCDQESRVSLDINARPEAKTFFKCGLLVLIEGKIQFTAPFMRIVLVHHLPTIPGGQIESPCITFDEFLLRAIERMNSEVLRNSLSVGKDYNSALLERQLQMEWY